MSFSNTIRLERLTQLKRVIILQQKAAAKRKPAKLNGISAFFDMRAWFIKVDEQYVKEGACSTAACALGSAALNPWFIKRGLKMVLSEETLKLWIEDSRVPHGVPIDRASLEKDADDDKDKFSVHYGEVKFKGHTSMSAGEKFFGISKRESLWLFDPATYNPNDDYVSPARVIKRIDDVIAHYKIGKDSKAYKRYMGLYHDNS